MRRFIILLLLVLLAVQYVSGQSNPEAINVLDRFSSKALSAPSVSMKFSLITINLTENTRDTLNGSLIMSKDQYRLEMPGNTVWFNGSVSWNYLVAEKEVTITRPDRKEESFMTRPTSIFTIYKKGYKTRLLQETESTYTIDLYPEDTNNELIRIRLIIGKNQLDLKSAEYKRKDGITMLLNVKEYNLRLVPGSSEFVFNPKEYSGVEIIDMR